MDSKQFKILVVVAIVLFAMAGIVHSAYDKWTPEKVDGEKLFPDFDGYAESIAKLMVQKGETKLTFTKAQDGTWSLMERGAYPVIPQKVRKILGRVANAERVEAKTRDPERYDLLALGDPAKQDATARLIKFNDTNGDLLGELIIGKQRFSAFGSGRSGSYVRRPDSPQTWLVNIVLDVPLDVSDWVEPVFFKLPSDTVRLVELIPADGEPVQIVLQEPAKNSKDETGTADIGAANSDDAGATQIAKQPPAKFAFVAIPEGKRLKDGVDATAMVKALETLELTDVRKAGGVTVPQDAIRIKARVETKDGMQLDITLLKIGEDERWVTIKVIADGKDVKAAKEIKAAVEGWEFKMTSWRSGRIFKTTAEIFDAKEEEKKTGEDPASTAPIQSGATNQALPPMTP